MTRRPVVGIMGGHAHNDEAERLAREIGEAVAREGWMVLTGGRNQGVMAAAATGCKAGGGFSIGIHPDEANSPDVAPDLDLVVFTGMGYARNAINILSSNAIVVLPGSFGTLSEAAYAQTFKVPTIFLGFDDKKLFDDKITRAATVDEAMKALRSIL